MQSQARTLKEKAMKTTASELNVRAFLLFLLAAAATAAWFGLTFSLPDPGPAGLPAIVLAILLCNGIILVGLWRALIRTDFTAGARVGVWLAIAVPYALWTAAVWSLAAQGTFRPAGGVNRLFPALPAAILLPVPVGLFLLTSSRRVASLLEVTPPSWLIGVQVYRILGGIFLVDWARGTLPGAFALPAGIGDVVVGLLALPAALWSASGTPFGRKVGVWWNQLGLTDFVVAIAMGMMTSPGRFQVFALDHANVRIGTFPTVMIPAFAVPSSILLHALSLWQLRRLATKPADARTIEQPGGDAPLTAPA
jgi:hypothetical protein